MLRTLKCIPLILVILLLCACGTAPVSQDHVAATTAPVAQFAAAIAEGTGIEVQQVITDSVSCLHDYSLSVRQMELIETSSVVLISGAGLEETIEDALSGAKAIVDCSEHVTLRELSQDTHDHASNSQHSHDKDPHIWLDPRQAKAMAETIRDGLIAAYPAHEAVFRSNTDGLLEKLDELYDYGTQALSQLTSRELITFHDGFGYLADAFDLTILAAIEEESGSEASAKDLTQLVHLVEEHALPAIFTEVNGSSSAASAIQAETGVAVYSLDMAMGGSDYFTAMRHNIDTLKEALQ